MNGITYIGNFVDNSIDLFEDLKNNIEWNKTMKARFTESFGVAYNYSQMTYPIKTMPDNIEELCKKIKKQFNFKPNNCLINFYLDGKSKMGFHSDQIDILAEDSGVAIISLGETRILRFRKIDNQTETVDYQLNSGSLIYMTQEVQKVWQHSIPKSKTENGRMSFTFRKIKQV
jgi:alkylated DNA repair dioxygenase AlkB